MRSNIFSSASNQQHFIFTIPRSACIIGGHGHNHLVEEEDDAQKTPFKTSGIINHKPCERA